MIAIEYLIIFAIALIGGFPLSAVLARNGYPAFGFIIWLVIFLFGIYAIVDVEIDRRRP